MTSAPAAQCPINSFRYNTTICACNPGYLYNTTAQSCSLFDVPEPTFSAGSGLDYYSATFPETIFSFDTIRKYTQSQAVFLEATLVMLLSWLIFCFFVRFGSLGNGRTIWFKIRWWISRLDVCFATRHWLDDQKVVMKRKTELGGTFSIASWILFIGLFAALLYQIIAKRTVEVHNVVATNAPDLASFDNDFEFNITTISSMSCSHLRGLGTLVTGNPSFIDYRIVPLSTFSNYSCQNTTMGPTVILRCNSCRLVPDNLYISWQFVDLPNSPATAVGFQFNITAKNHVNRKHVGFVSGTLKNGSNLDDKPVTFRGTETNVFKFNLFPRVYHNKHDLKLIQPLFHEFLPGSSFSEMSQLQTSLQKSAEGLINTTLSVNFLSAYVVEIDDQNILGPVGFLADLGGLYCISIGIFFYFLVQCEYRIKKLRYEDRVIRKVRSRSKAQERWEKLRKYVRYTWGRSSLEEDYNSEQKEGCCSGSMMESIHRNGLSQRRRQPAQMVTISFNKKVNLPNEKKATPEHLHTERIERCLPQSVLHLEERSTCSRGEQFEVLVGVDAKDGRDEHADDSHERNAYQLYDYSIPPPPSLEYRAGSEMTMNDIQRNLQNLYEYNGMLRSKLIATQSMLHTLTHNASTSEVKDPR